MNVFVETAGRSYNLQARQVGRFVRLKIISLDKQTQEIDAQGYQS